MRRPPIWLFGALVLAVSASGWTLAQSIGSSPYATVTDTIKTRLPGVTKGHVVTLPGGRKVVHVPVIIIHTDHKVIRVPAQNLPFKKTGATTRGLTAAVAQPFVPVTLTVYVPTTVYVPVPTTVVTTTTVTDIVPTTVTVSVPLDDVGGAS